MSKIIDRAILVIFIFIITSQISFIFADATSFDVAKEAVSISEKKYERHLLWGERFFNFHMNSLALKHFQKAQSIKPAAYFPQYRISQINIRLNQPQQIYFREVAFDFNKPVVLVSALIIVILFSLVSLVLALLTSLLNRNKRMKLEKRIQYLREEYQTLLIDYLLSNDAYRESLVKIRNIASVKLSRKVLIDQMIDLSITVTGNEKTRLKDLYLHLQLHKDSYKKAMNRKWYIKAKGFRELAFMNIPIANHEITRCLSSKNDILRMEAQFALIRLNPDNSFGFLSELEKKFTLWEQLNVYETIVFHELKLPDFEDLLTSKNSSVVHFALRMIKVFKLKKAFNSMVALLTHPDAEVRNQNIQVMGYLKMIESLPYLKKIYKNETYDNCLAIIQAMASINDESMLNFLRLVLDKEDDVQLQIEAAKAIKKIGVKGSETLKKLLQSDYKNYQIIVKHVLDKRIN